MRRVAGRNRVEKTRDVSLFSTGAQVDMTLTSLRAAFALQQLTPSNARPSTPLGGYSDWTVLGHVTTPWTNASGQGIGYANRLQPIAALLEADRCLGSPTQAHRCLQKDLRRPQRLLQAWSSLCHSRQVTSPLGISVCGPQSCVSLRLIPAAPAPAHAQHLLLPRLMPAKLCASLDLNSPFWKRGWPIVGPESMSPAARQPKVTAQLCSSGPLH